MINSNKQSQDKRITNKCITNKCITQTDIIRMEKFKIQERYISYQSKTDYISAPKKFINNHAIVKDRYSKHHILCLSGYSVHFKSSNAETKTLNHQEILDRLCYKLYDFNLCYIMLDELASKSIRSIRIRIIKDRITTVKDYFINIE